MRHISYKIEKLRDAEGELLDVPLTKDVVRMITQAHEQLLGQAESILIQACNIRGQACWNDQVVIDGDSIIGSGEDYCKGCHMGTCYSSCPVEYLWIDNWKEQCRKDHETEVQQKKDEEAARAEMRELDKIARERAEFKRLQGKFGSNT